MWFALALGAALAQSVQLAVIKGRARHLHPFVIMLWAQSLALGAWVAATWLQGDSFTAPWRLGGWVVAAIGFALAMNYLLTRASAGGDISLVAPVLAVSPIVAIAPDWLFTETLPHGIGWVGVGITVLGTISLSLDRSRGFALRRLLAREDTLCALGAAVAFGCLSAVDRRVTIAVGVPGYLTAIYVCQVPLTAALLRLRRPGAPAGPRSRRDVATLLLHGALALASTAMQLTAVTLAPVSYVNSVRQMSSVFTVLIGRVLFDEPGLSGRLAGALLMGLGAACLLFAR
jgi:drug/metabolite transporter (DMT)-like permease